MHTRTHRREKFVFLNWCRYGNIFTGMLWQQNESAGAFRVRYLPVCVRRIIPSLQNWCRVYSCDVAARVVSHGKSSDLWASQPAASLYTSLYCDLKCWKLTCSTCGCYTHSLSLWLGGWVGESEKRAEPSPTPHFTPKPFTSHSTP